MKNYRLYLLRHGVTQGNLQGIYVGSDTDEPLCAQGEAQLRALREAYPYPTVQTVFSSPLLRAVQSAELLFPCAESKIVLQDLRENHFGAFEGRKVQDLVHDEAFQKWIDPKTPYTPPGAESAHDFHLRCGEVLMKLFEYMMKSGIEEAGCVTHGGVIMSMLAQRATAPHAPEDWMADPGCGYVVQCSPEMWMRGGMVEVTDILPFGYLEQGAQNDTDGAARAVPQESTATF